jgi:hypothetical protein
LNRILSSTKVDAKGAGVCGWLKAPLQHCLLSYRLKDNFYLLVLSKVP